VGKELGPFAHQMISAPHEITGGPHLSRIDIGLGNQASSQQGGNLMGVYAIVLAFAAMNGPHVQGMTENKWDVLVFTEIGQPVPGEHALGGDDEILTEWLDRMQKDIRTGFHVSMKDGFSLLV
jgi:hypothetical protein